MGGYCSKKILGTDPNAPLAYDPGLELHQIIMSILEGNRGQLDRDRNTSSVSIVDETNDGFFNGTYYILRIIIWCDILIYAYHRR